MLKPRPHTAALLAVVSIAIGTSILPTSAAAKVVRVEITSRTMVGDSPAHGHSGSYEILKGTLHFEVDPDNPANQQIVDLELAPRTERGTVAFSADFELHKPLDPEHGNRRLIYFVNNRGNKHGAGFFSYGRDLNWLYRRGWSYLWCGWNGDVVEDDRKLNIALPIARDNGETITGRIYTEIISYDDDPVPSMPLVWGGSLAYPPISLDDPAATLTARRYRSETPVAIPRDQWSFARVEDGTTVPDPQSLTIAGGIQPGVLYELVYTGKDPRVTGLGLAAIRDAVSFFRYENEDDASQPNPLAGFVDHTFAWGHSQSGRLLNHFVYQNFNVDEHKRVVLDGLIANCPGAGKGMFNSRFAQTTRHGSHLEDHLYPIDIFPFATVEQQDPVTGKRADAFAAARSAGALPKMMFVNSATDYWTRAASLLHTDVEGTKDLGIDPNVRIYAIAGRAHVDSRLAFISRALLVALDDWVSFGTDPPDSQVPRIADGTLVGLDDVREAFPKIPGLRLPDSFYEPVRLDFGPRWATEGIADFVPPHAGQAYSTLVTQVDSDGNEIAGIRLPEIAVPTATYTGWSLRKPSFSNSLRRNAGTVWPFPTTAEEKRETGDPRRSLSERYPTSERWLAEVAGVLVDLQERRFLLEDDVAILLREAVEQAGQLEPQAVSE